MYKILENTRLSDVVFKLRIDAPMVARKYKPGQFVIIRLSETGERIPLTVVDTDPKEGSITLIIQEVGKTTRELGQLKAGDGIMDVIGPLGRAAEIEQVGTVVVVGGGVGTGVAYPEAKAFKEAGNEVFTIVGSRTADLLILEDELAAVSDELIICTDDGSKGHHGFVSDILTKMIKEGKTIDLVIAIGPAIMMKVICDLTRPHNLKTIISLNSIMVDGTGMCGSCRVTVGGRTRFVCVHGPEFDGHQVDFKEFMNRLRIYNDEEKVSLDKHKEVCGCH